MLEISLVDVDKGLIATGAQDGSVVLWKLNEEIINNLKSPDNSMTEAEISNDVELVLIQRELVVETVIFNRTFQLSLFNL